MNCIQTMCTCLVCAVNFCHYSFHYHFQWHFQSHKRCLILFNCLLNDFDVFSYRDREIYSLNKRIQQAIVVQVWGHYVVADKHHNFSSSAFLLCVAVFLVLSLSFWFIETSWIMSKIENINYFL